MMFLVLLFSFKISGYIEDKYNYYDFLIEIFYSY